jgi:hypothetical protein
MKTEIYRNLHKKCFSVRQNGRVVGHLMDDPTEHVLLENVRFAVQPAGHAKVLREQKKNVHAFVRGDTVSPYSSYIPDLHEFNKEIAYNPYVASFFYFNYRLPRQPIYVADYALIRHGKVWVR